MKGHPLGWHYRNHPWNTTRQCIGWWQEICTLQMQRDWQMQVQIMLLLSHCMYYPPHVSNLCLSISYLPLILNALNITNRYTVAYSYADTSVFPLYSLAASRQINAREQLNGFVIPVQTPTMCATTTSRGWPALWPNAVIHVVTHTPPHIRRRRLPEWITVAATSHRTTYVA